VTAPGGAVTGEQLARRGANVRESAGEDTEMEGKAAALAPAPSLSRLVNSRYDSASPETRTDT
jgi:hypothetical protein